MALPFTKIISKTITINASVSKVWDALTSADQIKNWLWDTEVIVISDWKVGSPILFKGKFHEMDFETKGIILKLEKEKVFKYSYWTPISEISDSPENYHIIEFALRPDGSKTLLTLTINNLINDVIYGHVNFYWNTTLEVLKKLLEK